MVVISTSDEDRSHFIANSQFPRCNSFSNDTYYFINRFTVPYCYKSENTIKV